MTEVKRTQEAPVNSYTYTGVIRYDQVYEGYVIDRVDPTGSGRVKVFIPELMGDAVGINPKESGIWVRALRKFQGQYMIPSLNQWVYITFLYGDPQMGIITGDISSGEEKNPYLTPVDYKETRNYFESIKREPYSSFAGYPEHIRVLPEYAPADKIWVEEHIPFFQGPLTPKEIKFSPDWYILALTPRNRNMISIMDAKQYNYLEMRSGWGERSIFICEADYAANTMGLKSPNSYFVLSELADHVRATLWTQKTATLELNDTDEQVFLKGHQDQYLAYTKDNRIILSNTVGYKKQWIRFGSCCQTRLNMKFRKLEGNDVKKLIDKAVDSPKKGNKIIFHNPHGITINSNGAYAEFGMQSGIIHLNP